MLADPRHSEHVPAGLLETRQAALAWIERYQASWAASRLGYWTVRLRATMAVIGVGGAERRPGFWNLYYLIDHEHRGCGYATELARAAGQQALAVDPDLPLAAWIHARNAASQIVAGRLGLSDYGLLEAGHWKGEPMHYWADREPAPGPGARADVTPG